MAGRAWFPVILEGHLVVLRRHVAENREAFRRWYADPEIARLARYTEGPMRADEVDRFFNTRAIGPESMALAIHVRGSDRLIGTCALSQLDGDNGSALFHITIGEKDAWGRGYGTEATRLMVDHALGTLRLHRISLSVFEFNERARRSYASCGFRVEGRAREAIWRDGRWWDEISMSVLDSDQRRVAAARISSAPISSAPTASTSAPPASGASRPVPSGSAASTAASPVPARLAPSQETQRVDEDFPPGGSTSAARGLVARLMGR